jgi:hypothetical protein
VRSFFSKHRKQGRWPASADLGGEAVTMAAAGPWQALPCTHLRRASAQPRTAHGGLATCAGGPTTGALAASGGGEGQCEHQCARPHPWVAEERREVAVAAWPWQPRAVAGAAPAAWLAGGGGRMTRCAGATAAPNTHVGGCGPPSCDTQGCNHASRRRS